MKNIWWESILVILIFTVCGAKCHGDTIGDLMHPVEIVGTTYAFSDVGYRIIKGNAQPIVPIIGIMGCFIYRSIESSHGDFPFGKYGLDCLGIALRTIIEVKF